MACSENEQQHIKIQRFHVEKVFKANFYVF